MGRAFALAAAITASLIATACVSSDPAPYRAPDISQLEPGCFAAGSAHDFRVADPRTVYFRAGHNVYRGDVLGTCRDLGWSDRMSLIASPPGVVCPGSGHGTSLVTRGPVGRQRCVLGGVAMLTPEQAEALPDTQRP